jgi:hypothetical protein
MSLRLTTPSRPVLLLVTILLSAGCETGTETLPPPPAAGPQPARTASADDTGGTPPGAEQPAANRTPQTDPWLFEGIPNFEDLVANRDGDWVVVLASAERSGAAPRPTIMTATDPGLAAVQQRVWNAGLVPFVIPSERLPGLSPKLVVVVLGPFAKQEAERQVAALRAIVPDAYVKKSW